MMEIEVVLDAGAIIGESPTWASGENALYWIDVKRPALYRYDPATGQQKMWGMPSDLGAFALVADPPGAIVALRYGIFRLDFASESLTLLASPPFDPALFRFNEGACDSAGRFWVGVMFDPLAQNQLPQKASLHCFTLSGGLKREPDAAELHNGMAWSKDERLFYLSHSRSGEVFAYPFDPQTARLGARKLFIKTDKSAVPDGAAVDTDDGYWCALHGAGRLRRYCANGQQQRDIVLPVSQPTMCAFGGEGLDVLYVTSAAQKLSRAQRQREPLAGALLRLRPGERGIVRHYLLR
ncbi:MAG TPA: SMP-30/gluconolactonase/LRE family protein [Steroidobacteraceae bacterium]|jgi:sugar lactone lactonase YvrE|nr:SMP-30/gluconolactonase/LRE family protein [Steroidobacteraceae bacterium]